MKEGEEKRGGQRERIIFIGNDTQPTWIIPLPRDDIYASILPPIKNPHKNFSLEASLLAIV